jgi:hypothetical protein
MRGSTPRKRIGLPMRLFFYNSMPHEKTRYACRLETALPSEALGGQSNALSHYSSQWDRIFHHAYFARSDDGLSGYGKNDRIIHHFPRNSVLAVNKWAIFATGQTA